MQPMQVLPAVDYVGEAGVNVIRQLQGELAFALAQEDWGRVQHLDQICALVVDRVIAANRHDKPMLLRALTELKGVYKNLLHECRPGVDAVGGV